MSDRKTKSVKVDPSLWKEAKHLAIEKDTTLSEIVENGIKKVIREETDDREK